MSKLIVSDEELSLDILTSLRKIIRAIDLYSKKLSSETSLTSPQVLSLLAVAKHGPITLADLAAMVHLSSSTMVGIIDRLEAKELLVRERSKKDRRQVFISITQEGKKLAKKSPTPLQEKLISSLMNLSDNQKKNILKSLDILVDILDAKKINADTSLAC